MNAHQTQSQPTESTKFSRRSLVIAGSAATAGLAALAFRCRKRSSVFIAKNQKYDDDLTKTISDGLTATGFDGKEFAGKNVLLKPNMVEPSREIPHMTTHPAVIIAAANVFRSWGAEVTVGEAPGHVRDSQMALEESGVGEALVSNELVFADLNYEEIGWQKNLGRRSQLKGFYFPQSVLAADFIVSMPKMKTHHWVGVTAAMKNMYGVIPGIKYGWPKNVLHYNGIPETVIDINASLPQTIGIVDGIDCMEGDGPIMGSLKPMGLIVVGKDLPGLDATVTRIMGLKPERIPYLQLARRLGPIRDGAIEQRGEAWKDLVRPFKVMDLPHLRALRQSDTGPLVT